LSNLNGRTDNPGWLCSPVNVFAQKSSSLNGGIRISSNVNTLAWIETPELDLSKPVVLDFESKKWTKEGEGSLYGVVDGDTVMYVLNQNNTISPRKSVSFFAGEKSRIRLVGKKTAANDICIDSIRVTQVDEPTLSLPLIKVVDMGKVQPGGTLNYTLPVGVLNSSGILNFVLPADANFSMTGATTIEFNDEISSSSVDFVFNAPEQVGTYTARVTVDGGTDFDPRVIWLKATVDPAAGIKNSLEDKVKITMLGKQISIISNEKLQVKLFSVTGQLLSSSQENETLCEINAPYEGVFLLHMKSNAGLVTRKIIVK